MRSIVEDIMLEVMYELPDLEVKGKHVVTEEVAKGERALFERKLPVPAIYPEKKIA